MSWLVRRALLLVAIGGVVGVASGLIWPGDVIDDSVEVAHLFAIGGFLLTAVLLMVAAGMVFVAVLGDTWRVKGFNLNEYLERMKRRR